MGNNNFLGYVAGAYQNQQQQNRANEEFAMRRRQQELAIQNMLESQRRLRDDDSRRKKRDEREDEEYNFKKQEREKLLESRNLAPILRPFVPELYTDPTGKQTLETVVPSELMGGALSAAGAGSFGLPDLSKALPSKISVPNFETGDQLEKRRAKEEAIELEIDKRRRLADEGLIRDYNRYPIGSRTGRQAGSSGGGSSSGASLNASISAPEIQPYQPYKNPVDLYSRGSDDEKQAFNLRVKELSETTALSPAEAKNVVLADLNKISAQNHQAAVAAEKERRRREELSKKPKIDIDPDRIIETILYGQGSVPPGMDRPPIPRPEEIETQPAPAPAPVPFQAPGRAPAGISSPGAPTNFEESHKNTIRDQLQNKLQPVQAAQQAFVGAIQAAEKQTGRPLSDDEKGLLADLIFNQNQAGNFDPITGTYQFPNAIGPGRKVPISSILGNVPGIGKLGPQNLLQGIKDTVSSPLESASGLANWGTNTIIKPPLAASADVLNSFGRWVNGR